jgi:monofunctional biosynthetic peptidoglycan transglycosylase
VIAPHGWLRFVGRTAAAVAAGLFAIVTYSWLTLPDVRPLRTQNPTDTAFMRLRAEEAVRAGRPAHAVQRWVSYDRIAPNLKLAVRVAEDGAFWQHDGLDYEEIRSAIEANLEHGEPLRGASTITQQLAKNLYLSPSRNPLRKLEELFITRRLEAELTKTRILELYLNVVEWGDGIWGAEAAARAYFNIAARDLTREQAALLAGALINPRVYSPAHPNARLLRRQQIILGRMGEQTGRLEAGPAVQSTRRTPSNLPRQ